MYLRFKGDRRIDEKDFGRVQKDRIKELRLWSDSVRSAKDKAKFAIVAAVVLLGVIAITVVTIPQQQAEAAGCYNGIAINASKG